jgi:hypothetical protein
MMLNAISTVFLVATASLVCAVGRIRQINR